VSELTKAFLYVYNGYMTTELTETAIRQLTLAIDLDNTSTDYTNGLRHKAGKQLGINPAQFAKCFPQVTDYAMWKNNWFGMSTQQEFYDLHSKAVENGLFEDLVPYEGVSEALWRFHEAGHHIRIVTARFLKPGDRYKVMETTSKFLDKHSFPVDDIAFTDRKVEVMADVYVDDSPSNIINLTAAGRTVIIYHQEYNAHLEGLRAYNWADVERFVNEIAAS
jgi:5'(3')-deoxyribonucleotidase